MTSCCHSCFWLSFMLSEVLFCSFTFTTQTVLVSWLYFLFFLLYLHFLFCCTHPHTQTLSLIFYQSYSTLHFHHGNCQSRVMTGQAVFRHLQWHWPCHNNVRDTQRKVVRTKSCHHLRVCGFVFQCGDPGTCEKSSIWSIK